MCESKTIIKQKGIAELAPCAECGSGFVKKHPLKIYCSSVCRIKVKKAKELERIGKSTCVSCGNEFQPKGQADPKHSRLNKYCSTHCRTSHPDWKHRKYITAGTGFEPYYSVYFNNCIVCSNLFTAKRHDLKLCSAICKSKLIEINKEKANKKAYENSLSNYEVEDKNCPECNKKYITVYGVKRKGYCSEQCSKRHNARIGKSVRKARIKQVEYEPVDSIKVFERDKWVCRICGTKTPRKHRGTILETAPELDHIIPISKGGPHTYWNVQCACRKCNSAKSDKIIGQLPLFNKIAA